MNAGAFERFRDDCVRAAIALGALHAAEGALALRLLDIAEIRDDHGAVGQDQKTAFAGIAGEVANVYGIVVQRARDAS